MKYICAIASILSAVTAPAFAGISMTVTSPVNGSTVTSPVHYVASSTTSCAKGISAMGIYVDNKLIYTVKTHTLNTTITLGAGAQHTVVEAWDKCGAGFPKTENLTVESAKKVSVTIAASPTSIAAGGSSTLTVTAANATKVTVTSASSTPDTLGATGGKDVVKPTATTTYTATATGSGGTTATATVTVTVNPLPTVAISASPGSVLQGKSSTLTVTAANATAVTVTSSSTKPDSLGSTGGTDVVSPTATTTYTATATGFGGATASATATVTVNPSPTVSISANPASIVTGGSSKVTVTAANATGVVVIDSNNVSYPVGATGGSFSVSPAATDTFTATATGFGGATATANTTVTVGPKALTSISVSPAAANFAMGTTQQFTAMGTYSDSSTADVTGTANWSVANQAVATIASGGLASSVASGSTTVSASLNGVSGSAPFTVSIAPGTGVTIPTWHADTYRSGLNANEQSLSTNNVSAQTFGKLFTYIVNGYAYAQPLLVSGVTINGNVHNVLYVATETNDVYAFDADNYGTGAPLWHVNVMMPGESPDSVGSGSAIYPVIGITSTPVIDTTTGTMYVVSKQTAGHGSFFRLNALDITTGNQILNGPVVISASIPTDETSEFPSGYQTLTASCIQRSALLEAYGNVYFGFGSCHSGWMLAFDTQTLLPTGIFNSSPNLDGEGQYASAGGVWMGGGGPASNGDGFVYITTGNGPFDGLTAFADSVLQFNPPTLSSSSPVYMEPASFFTPQPVYSQYMDCSDGDMASGGLLLIPGTTQALAGAKTAWMYLVNTANLGGQQANDAGALDTLIFENDLGTSNNNATAFSKSCTDTTLINGSYTHTIQASHYEVYGTSAYFNGSVYLGITADASEIPAGLRQFTLSGNTLTPGTYTADATQEEIRGTTPFISANGTSDGVVWMIDQGEPLAGSAPPATATLRAFDPNNLANELYDSNMNPGDQPGYGIKFTSPIVANGKVYISTGNNLTTASQTQGRIDVYGLN